MFKLVQTSFVLLLTLSCYAQIDSSIYYFFSSKDKFPNVTDVYHSRIYFTNNQLKSEGWIVEEKAGSTATILSFEKSTDNILTLHKFGIWKYYYRNGDVKAIDTIFYDENGHRYGSQNFFSHAGQLYKRFELSVNQEIKTMKALRGTEQGEIWHSPLYATETMFLYNRNGKVIRKIVWLEGEVQEDLAYDKRN
jgi:antitoxin component YwqK of YwqJK toxin-antitoxin module